MELFLEGYLTSAAGFAALAFLCALLNLLTLPRLRPDSTSPAKARRVSVVVPARNEASNIRPCLESLLAQNHANFELIVLDDQSTDDTPKILAELSARDPRLRVIAGKPLPAGWVGKCWACQQLGEAADGEWLLFTDADTVHQPASVSAAVTQADRSGADLLSVWPYQQMETAGEKLVIPVVMHTILLSFAPLVAIEKFRFHRIAAGCGQFLLWRREAYRRFGGHERVRGRVLEDVAMARAALRDGLRLRQADGLPVVRTRMYRSFPQLWEGFSKNLYAIAGGTWLTLAGALLGAVGLLVFPWFLAPILSAMGHPLAPWAWAVVVLTFLRRLALAIRFQTSIWSAALHPVGALLTAIITIRSAWLCETGRGVVWKARSFQATIE